MSFACFVVSTGLSHAADAAIVRLWPGWRETDSFDRIGEFLGGPEPAGRRTLLRSQPDARAGYYFLLRVASPAALTAGAKFELQVIRPDAPEPKTFTFPVTAPAGDTVFDLGVTGTDWPGGKKASPVAYRLTLLAADGRVLVEHKSFLWEKPAK
ncbi:MAG: hypothetical protein NTV51_13690 [Verrucomicrobia bacterium]|nr:hypothetical protein [Verrucomicrobiota bacterium]